MYFFQGCSILKLVLQPSFIFPTILASPFIHNSLVQHPTNDFFPIVVVRRRLLPLLPSIILCGVIHRVSPFQYFINYTLLFVFNSVQLTRNRNHPHIFTFALFISTVFPLLTDTFADRLFFHVNAHIFGAQQLLMIHKWGFCNPGIYFLIVYIALYKYYWYSKTFGKK